MHTLLLAEEGHIVEMTEDTTMAMKKPHRNVLIKEWRKLQQRASALDAVDVTEENSQVTPSHCRLLSLPLAPESNRRAALQDRCFVRDKTSVLERSGTMFQIKPSCKTLLFETSSYVVL
jgi:hypothetical protein